MADSKFAGLRAIRPPPPVEAEQPAAPPRDVPQPVSAASAPDIQPVRGRGRPAGKRSNPDWKLYSHFLKRQTQRQATNILRNQDNGRDLSDVLQELLEKWVAQQQVDRS